MSCSNNLMQLGLALHQYVAEHNVLPPGVVNDTAPIASQPQGLHWSWLVQVLPFLDQPDISRRIRFQAGAYDPVNQTLRTTALNVLLCPDNTGASHEVSTGVALCSYAGCHHDVEAPIDTDNHGVLFLNSRVRLDDVTDGLAHTVFVGELARPHPLGWISGTRATLRNTGHRLNHPARSRGGAAGLPAAAADEELEPDEFEEQILTGQIPVGPFFVGGFSSQHRPDGANFAFGDGSVRFVKASVDPEVYRRLGHRSDGELLDDDAF